MVIWGRTFSLLGGVMFTTHAVTQAGASRGGERRRGWGESLILLILVKASTVTK